ncbi:MAG: O-antigen ligase family protein [Bacteroidaceae bacterium]|nr:O-antigen ligase family protein [Bacteroidaceae bacterium]
MIRSIPALLWLAILLGTALWSVSNLFVDAEFSAKWYLLLPSITLGVILGTISQLFTEKDIKKLLPTTNEIVLIILAVSSSQGIYGILQALGISTSPYANLVVGSFDNPAGFASALAFSFPFCFTLWRTKQRILQGIGILAGVILIFAIVASNSRTGMFTIAGVWLAYLFYTAKHSKKVIGLATVIALVSLLCFFYFYKKDSADGRVLIWKCTSEMIEERPLLGYGPSGFEANYMDFQAKHFVLQPQDKFAQLADNVKWPFNEYLQLVVSYGLVGGIALLVLVVLLIQAWRKHPSTSSTTAMGCLLSIALFSLFSYPFSYPFTWILFVGSIIILFYNAYPIKLGIQQNGLIIASLLLGAGSFLSIQRMRAEMEWCKISDLAMCGQGEEAFPTYERLKKELWRKPTFLYNYAAELNMAGHYNKSIEIGLECQKHYADYDLQLLLADNYFRSKQYEKAEACYKKANRMCPNRFEPLNELYFMYKKTGNSLMANQLGKEILNKPIKISSPEVKNLRNEVISDLKN